MNTTKYAMRLYAVTDSSWLRGRSLVQMVEEAILGGATFVQLREKEADQEAMSALAKKVEQATSRRKKPRLTGRTTSAPGRPLPPPPKRTPGL